MNEFYDYQHCFIHIFESVFIIRVSGLLLTHVSISLVISTQAVVGQVKAHERKFNAISMYFGSYCVNYFINIIYQLLSPYIQIGIYLTLFLLFIMLLLNS